MILYFLFSAALLLLPVMLVLYVIGLFDTGSPLFLQQLEDVLKAMSKGKPFSIVPVATEVTTQSAAEILGCSRPFLVKLLEEGKITFTKVGRHRRIKFEDVMAYKQKMKEEQKMHLIDMMSDDEELGLYDT